MLVPALSKNAGSIAATLAALWGAWYALVLRPASLRLKPWGPRWLAVLVSAVMNRFGRSWLNWSDNAKESLETGVWGPGKQYVMAWHPHGAFTIASLYFVSHWWASDYPGGTRGDRYVCVAPLLLRIPFLAEYLLLCHARSQDSKTFDGLLASGATVAVQPGGLIEQVATDDQQEQVFFPARLGFIRLAMKHGVPLLPVYSFGENQIYPTASWTRRLNHWIYRKFKTGNLVVLGQLGIPCSPVLPNPLVLPTYGSGLHLRFGEPVDTGSAEANPSDEQVQEVFKKYMNALQKIFDAHKDTLLPPEVAARGLKVVYRGEEDKANGSPSRSKL